MWIFLFGYNILEHIWINISLLSLLISAWWLVFIQFPHLSFFITDWLVELLALQTKKVFSGLQDATFGSDGAGSVDIVTSNHAHSNACSLALRNGLWNL